MKLDCLFFSFFWLQVLHGSVAHLASSSQLQEKLVV